MLYELSADELAAQDVLALPARELLDTLTIVTPTQIVTALNLAIITTGDVKGDVVVAQESIAKGYQHTEVDVESDECCKYDGGGKHDGGGKK